MDTDDPSVEAQNEAPSSADAPGRHRFVRWTVRIGLIVVLGLIVARIYAPTWVRSYVNRAIGGNALYTGKIGDVHLHLWRGAYSIDNVRLLKSSGSVPVPFFSARHVELALEWKPLLRGKVVGKVIMDQPQLNYVDAENEAESQTGGVGVAGAPWLVVLRGLFPFRLNSCQINDGAIAFRAFHKNPPVDVHLSHVNATMNNFTNIYDQTAPLIATVDATALVMDTAALQYSMKLDPSSYRPTFQMALRMVGLDVTRLNALTRGYGAFDFEKGWFDLVIELKSNEGAVSGYIKPLFRNLSVFSLSDLGKDNPLEAFWEALVGVVSGVLSNQQRQQFATLIPISGQIEGPRPDVLTTLGNVLRNAFVRAYLPRLQRDIATDVSPVRFGTGSFVETEPSRQTQ